RSGPGPYTPRKPSVTSQGRDAMQVTWLGHSAFRIEDGQHVILIDPFLSGNGRYTDTVERAARGCTHVVLTHGHDDHVGDTVDICTATGATLVAVYELAMHLG